MDAVSQTESILSFSFSLTYPRHTKSPGNILNAHTYKKSFSCQMHGGYLLTIRDLTVRELLGDILMNNHSHVPCL